MTKDKESKSINLAVKLTAEQQSLLRELIEQELVNKQGLKLKRGKPYPLDKAKVSVVLTHSIVKRKSNHDKVNPFRYVVLASKVNDEGSETKTKLGTGTCGKIKTAIRTFVFKQVGKSRQLISKEKIKAYKVIEFNSKVYPSIADDPIWGDDVFREGHYFSLAHGHTKEPIFRLDKNGQPQAYLFMPILSGNDLNKVIRDPSFKNKDLSYRIQLILSVLDALDALHKMNIIHCDIKSANLLWEEKTHKTNITDFGYATDLNNSITSNCGTPKYVAPEAAFRPPLTYKADIYSFIGVIADILGAPSEFFKNSSKPAPDSYNFYYLPNPSQYLNNITKYNPQEINELDEKFLAVLKHGSTNNPKTRCELTDIKNMLIEVQEKFYPTKLQSQPAIATNITQNKIDEVPKKLSGSKILGYIGLIALLLIGIALILTVKLAPLGIPIAAKTCALIANMLHLGPTITNIFTLVIGTTAAMTSTLTFGVIHCKNALLHYFGVDQQPKQKTENSPDTYKKLTDCLGWNDIVKEISKPSQEVFTRSLFKPANDSQNESQAPTNNNCYII